MSAAKRRRSDPRGRSHGCLGNQAANKLASWLRYARPLTRQLPPNAARVRPKGWRCPAPCPPGPAVGCKGRAAHSPALVPPFGIPPPRRPLRERKPKGGNPSFSIAFCLVAMEPLRGRAARGPRPGAALKGHALCEEPTAGLV